MVKNIYLISSLVILCLPAIGQQSGDKKQFKLAEELFINMIWVEPGDFMMGSPDDEPERYADREARHQVKITKGFWIADTETTQTVWEQITGNNPSKVKGQQHPVEQVSWNDIQQFLAIVHQIDPKFRLPYEAEWEMACRAGSIEPYAGIRDELTWHRGNTNGTSHQVATKKPNDWGIYDMHGNVLELCQDWFTEDITGYTKDPKGPEAGTMKVARGGQYTGRIRHSRSADRQRAHVDQRLFFMGFRLVRDQ